MSKRYTPRVENEPDLRLLMYLFRRAQVDVHLDVSQPTQHSLEFQVRLSCHGEKSFHYFLEEGMEFGFQVTQNGKTRRMQSYLGGISRLEGIRIRDGKPANLTFVALLEKGRVEFPHTGFLEVEPGEITFTYNFLTKPSNSVTITLSPESLEVAYVLPTSRPQGPPNREPDRLYCWDSERYLLENSRDRGAISLAGIRQLLYQRIRWSAGLDFAEFDDDVDQWLDWLDAHDTSDRTEVDRIYETQRENIRNEKRRFYGEL